MREIDDGGQSTTVMDPTTGNFPFLLLVDTLANLKFTTRFTAWAACKTSVNRVSTWLARYFCLLEFIWLPRILFQKEQ